MGRDRLSACFVLATLAGTASGQLTGPFPAVIELSSLNGANGFVLNGIDAGDRSGRSVSSAGDVNGDGIGDIIVGASSGDPSGVSAAGETYVVFGRAGGGFGASLELSLLNGSNGFVLNGIDAQDASGRSVSSAGDVNADGYSDLIIGAFLADPNGRGAAGESYVVFGGPGVGAGGSMSLGALNGQNGFVLRGIDPNDFSGRSVSSAGDVNGDGVDDLIIGAYRADPNGNSYAGESYVVFGGAGVGGSGVIELSGLNGSNGFVINGVGEDDLSGGSVSSAGDVNGDGVDDVIVGARGAQPHAAYVIFGGPDVGSGGSVNLSAINGSNGFVLVPDESTDGLGRSVSCAGDVNGDGVDDLIVGTPEADLNPYLNGFPRGASYVVFGGPGVGASGSIHLGALDGSDGFLLRGIDLDDNSGYSVSAAGDVNGDGVDDIMIGAYSADPSGRNSAGETYIVFGGPDVGASGSTSLASLNGSNGFLIPGIDSGDLSGHQVSSAGDVNGDGVDDVLIGAYQADPNGSSYAGESYVIFGRTTQVWNRTGGGSFGTASNWLTGTVPAGGSVRIEPRFGGTISLSQESDLFLDKLVLRSERGTAILNIGPASLVSLETPTVIEPSAGIAGGGILIADAGLTNDGLLAGPDLAVVSAAGVSNTGLIDIDGRLSTGVSRVEVFGTLRNDVGGEIRLRQGGADLAATGISNAGAINVAFADAAMVGDVENRIVMPSATGFVMTGGDAADYSGVAVALAGDVNGDGVDDLIIGANGADPGGKNDAGESYVVFGGPGVAAGAAVNLGALDGADGFVLAGSDAYDYSGVSVSSAGDVNGDGVDDMIIGAYAADPNGIGGAGASYVVFGGPAVGAGGSIKLATLDGSNGFVLTGIDPADGSGRSVSSAGDVNGDGTNDLIIGAADADPNGRSNAGESYLVFGGPGVGAPGSIDLGSLDRSSVIVFTGIDAGDSSGFSVSSAGDVNADGVDDLIIAASRADPNGTSNAGESYVVFGGAAIAGAATVSLGTLNGSNGFVLNGIDAGDYSGRSVSLAGDINGDGVSDLIIGAPRADPNGKTNAGESYVVFGGPGVGAAGSVNLGALNGSNGFVLIGVSENDYSGGSVSSAGDVNGDGHGDILIGASQADPNGSSDAGESYVVFGGPGVGASGSVTLGTLNGSNGFVVTGIDANDQSGAAVSAAGDINGDGLDDLIIGAFRADPEGTSNAGASSVIFGRGPASTPFPAVIRLDELATNFDVPKPGVIAVASNSRLLFADDLSNPGSIVLAADSEISIFGSLAGNGVSGPSGPGSAGPVFAFDGILPGQAATLGPGSRSLAEASTGVMRFDGDLQLSPSSRVVLEIRGTAAGTGHDQIVVAGTLGLAGVAEIHLADGFVPARGTCLRLFEFAGATGSFASVLLPQALIDLDADTSLLGVTGELIIPEDLPDLAEPFGSNDIFDLLTYLRRTDAGEVKIGDMPPRDGAFSTDDVVRFIQLLDQ